MIEKTYHIITFGCQMNVHDSHWLGRALNARGFFEAPLEDAQVVVVNTCSVREKPEQKVMSTLGRIRQVSGGNPAVLVCVAGCVAQQLGESQYYARDWTRTHGNLYQAIRMEKAMIGLLLLLISLLCLQFLADLHQHLRMGNKVVGGDFTDLRFLLRRKYRRRGRQHRA